MTNIFLNNGKC